jgi:pimeloyl-ACP methyl ester carboxylesterase
MERGYVKTPGGQLHYITEGEGAALLLLHQVPSSSMEYVKLIPVLSKQYRVIALDSPGYGMSDKPELPLAIPDYARNVVEFLAALGIEQCHLFGHHTGASIAVEVAAAYPETVAKLILSGCPHYTEEVRHAKLQSDAFQPPQPKADGSHITDAWNTILRYVPGATPEIATYMVLGRLLAGERGEEGHQAVFQYDIESRLPQIKCPTLLFSTDGDAFMDRLEVTGALIPGCLKESAPGDGLPTLTDPELLGRVITNFTG